MCGICGIIDLKQNNRIQDRSIIRAMTNTLVHRGPDQESYFENSNLAIGFRRLSIIGLDNGQQPITNEDNSLVLVCNGEIFNYVELKGNLLSAGHNFKTDTDVEVILHLYEEKGIAVLDELSGQFAFVILDLKKGTFICARDQFGIIPFYYTVVDDYFVFGSEIKAILKFPLYKKKVDMVGLDQVFSFPGIISPRTMFDNVLSLKNGYYLLYDGVTLKDKEYWDLVYPEVTDSASIKSEDYYVEALNDLLNKSIKIRLRSDVPIGFYLSGGLDSSLIGCKAFKISNGKVRMSFSITFNENDINEDKYQRIVSDYLNLDHKSQLFLYSDISKRLPQAIYHSECALKETYNTASLALSESVKENGLKVILTGEGADELFAGYVGYKFDVIRKMNGLDPESNSPEERHLRNKIWGDSDFFYEKNKYYFRKVRQNIYSKKFYDDFEAIDCLNHFIVNSKRIVNRDIIHQRSYLDFKLRLVDHLVTDHGDKMAMANSVEARYPFLDKDLVNFACTVPPAYKLNDWEEKYIVKKVANGQIPHEIVNREKFGFVAPGSPYLLKRNIEYINDILSYETIKRQGYFNADKVEEMKKQYIQDGFHINIPFDSDLLLIVLTHGIFLDQFQMPSV